MRIQALRNRFATRSVMLAPAILFVAIASAQPTGVDNFHKVNDRLYRGAQPTASGFRSLSEMGVKTVLDLRETDSRSREEKRQVEAAGMKYVNIPLQGTNVPANGDVAMALALLNDSAAGPVFVHCRRGADRTGTVIAAYRITHDRWTGDKALREAKDLGMAWYARGMMSYIRDYKPPVQNAATAEAAGTF
jgi:tyrosine-protein phosphatase SIW14